MKRQNITLSLPKDVLESARRLAVARGESLSDMLAGLIARVMNDDRKRRQAQIRIENRLAKGLQLGTQGEVSWTREDLH
jgi:hypothetical protein